MKLTGFWIFWRITSYKMAMNRWIPLNVETVDQARTARLARTLHCEIALALGYVCALWTWSARLALDGDLSDLLAGDIAHAAKYSGDDPEAFLSALISCGFIDEATDENGEVKTTISDWGYHAGGLMEMERRNELHRERQRRYRKRTSRDCDVTVTSRVTSHKRHGDATERHGDVMKHHRDPLNKDINRDKDINREKELNKRALKDIVHQSNEIVIVDDSDVSIESSGTRRSTYPADFDEFWSVYPRKDGKKNAARSWGRLPARDKALALGVARVMGEISANGGGPERQYILQPATFLNGERWNDWEEGPPPSWAPDPDLRRDRGVPDIEETIREMVEEGLIS